MKDANFLLNGKIIPVVDAAEISVNCDPGGQDFTKITIDIEKMIEYFPNNLLKKVVKLSLDQMKKRDLITHGGGNGEIGYLEIDEYYK